MKGSQISYLWKNPDAARNFSTGVSLHSHTNRSKETLDFVVKVIVKRWLLGTSLRWLEASHSKHATLKVDYARGLLDAAAHAAPRLRSGAPPDREQAAALRARLHHRPRQHRSAAVAAHRRQRSSHPCLCGMDACPLPAINPSTSVSTTCPVQRVRNGCGSSRNSLRIPRTLDSPSC